MSSPHLSETLEDRLVAMARPDSCTDAEEACHPAVVAQPRSREPCGDGRVLAVARELA